MRIFWFLIGCISLGLGVLGIVLPLLPTVPFILLAAFCYARSSERVHDWLISHRTFGPMIEDWRRNGAISTGVKRISTLSVAMVFGISLALGLRPLIIIIQGVTLVFVLVFIWTRPNS